MSNEYGREFTVKTITKADFKTGYRVKCRNGVVGIVFMNGETKNYGTPLFCILDLDYNVFITSDDIDDETFNYIGEDTGWDIIEVRSCYIRRTFLEHNYEDLPIIWTREDCHNGRAYFMYRADFEIDNGEKYDKHTALLLAHDMDDAWDKFNELIIPLLQYDENVYEPKIEEVKVSTDSFVYIDLIKKDNETKDFIIKKMKDNNYSFETEV